MTFNEYINKRRKECRLTVDELSEKSGVPRSTLSKITAGTNRNPTLMTARAICLVLRCSLDEALGLVEPTDSQVGVSGARLTKKEWLALEKYRSMDRYGQELLQTVLMMEYERIVSQCAGVNQQGILRRPFYLIPVSAGLGNPLDEAAQEEMEIADTPEHRRGDFIVRVSGDSMLPQFSDGDRVLVARQPSVEIGEIGIFVLNGESYIKKLGTGELLSLNPHYPPKPYSASDSILCCGRVIAKV
ncbi:MAG: helix-turn-helix domain-containing protein [Clostridia bacterium]|nr:helix-turn-helix domain-containing protein [Clostridia bacterium]